ncbi:MAG: transglutaminaseTgpA domain-containing protein [Rhizobacter sp.]
MTTSPRWRGLRHLPREARDTLFLLGVIAWTVLPHVGHLPVWCSLLTGTVLLWRAWLAATNSPLPGRWLPVAVLVVATACTLLSFRTLLGKEPGVTMAVVLMALKTLELRARRDAFVVFFLGFFLVLTHFLYSQSLLVAFAMLGSVWGMLTALVLAHMPVGRPPLRQAGGLALRTAALGAPVMVLLFVLFPRMGPLWGVPQDALATTGLSNELSFGSVAEIATDDRIAMRLRFPDGAPAPSQLYFRGPVLTRFDGRVWSPLNTDYPLPAREEGLAVNGQGLRYEVTLEPSRLPVLALLDATPTLPPLDGLWTRRREDLSWATNRPIRERVRFVATAYPNFVLDAGGVSDAARTEALRLPATVAPRTRAWARELGARPGLAGADAAALSAAVMQHIRSGGYSYTLAPGAYGEVDAAAAIDEFWLDRREGFCEHFAATYVVILRELGVPARIVTGFQGTDPTVVDGFHIVRQSQAHAWAEYWHPARGWTRADPTAAVAPERIFSSRNLRPPPGLMSGAIDTVSPELSARLRALWESVDNRWNQWVLNYARGQQLDLLSRLGFSAPSWQDLARLLVLVLTGLSLAGAAWAWWDRQRQDPWRRQALAIASLLRPLGIEAALHDTPRQLAALIRQRFGAAGEPLASLLLNLERERYGPSPITRPSNAWLSALRSASRRLRSAAPLTR